MKSESLSLSCVRLFAIQWTVACQAPCPWDSPGKSTGVGCHFLLQGIFPTVTEPGFPAWWVDSLPLSHQGRPLISSCPNINNSFTDLKRLGKITMI